MKRHCLVTAGCVLAMLSTSPAAKQAGNVLIGYCVGLKGLEIAKSAGFDYVEVGVTEIAALSDADFDAALERVKAGWHSNTQRQSLYPWKHEADRT